MMKILISLALIISGIAMILKVLVRLYFSFFLET